MSNATGSRDGPSGKDRSDKDGGGTALGDVLEAGRTRAMLLVQRKTAVWTHLDRTGALGRRIWTRVPSTVLRMQCSFAEAALPAGCWQLTTGGGRDTIPKEAIPGGGGCSDGWPHPETPAQPPCCTCRATWPPRALPPSPLLSLTWGQTALCPLVPSAFSSSLPTAPRSVS